MSIDPKRIFAQVALRTLQLDGSNQADLQVSYDAGTLDGADLPSPALVDSVLASEGRIAHLIGMDKLNPFRMDLYGKSDDLASGDEVPGLDEDGFEFLGVYSQVTDSDDDTPLTEQPIQVVRRFLRGSLQQKFITMLSSRPEFITPEPMFIWKVLSGRMNRPDYDLRRTQQISRLFRML
jgi:hypothetical protein